MASSLLAHERPDHTLQPTALVHEAWLRLAAYRAGADLAPGELELLASHVMRRVLTDHARRRARQKRDAGRAERIEGLALSAEDGAALVVEVDLALDELAELDPELARVVELRFFGGHTLEEVARATGLSLSSVNRRWRLARAWLRGAIEGGAGEGA